MKEEREKPEAEQEETTEPKTHKIEKKDTNLKENNQKPKRWTDKAVAIADQRREDTIAMIPIDQSNNP